MNKSQFAEKLLNDVLWEEGLHEGACNYIDGIIAEESDLQNLDADDLKREAFTLLNSAEEKLVERNNVEVSKEERKTVHSKIKGFLSRLCEASALWADPRRKIKKPLILFTS